MTKPKINIEHISFGNIAGKIIFWMTFIIICLAFVFGGFYTIDSGEKGVLLTFGKANPSPSTQGLHFKIPFVQQIVKFDIRTQKVQASASAASKDLQTVKAEVAVNYHLVPSEVVNIYSSLGVNFDERVIQPSVQEVVKAVTARFTAEELITNRPVVKEEILSSLKERLESRSIVVEDISITNFDFSESFNVAIEQKVTAEQLKLKAGNDLERIKIEAQQVEAQAVGQKLASIARAEGQAQSIMIVDQQLRNSPQYVDWFKVDKWNGELPQVTGGAVPFISVNKNDGVSV